jgi:phosphoenolpyruvate-protein kinase (PTS system EI component)
MIKVLVALAVVLGLTNFSFAQSYCRQVRQAVATYGYAAAKRHAQAHYSKKQVRAADRCLSKGHPRRG